jgi:hypothetical protein
VLKTSTVIQKANVSSLKKAQQANVEILSDKGRSKFPSYFVQLGVVEVQRQITVLPCRSGGLQSFQQMTADIQIWSQTQIESHPSTTGEGQFKSRSSPQTQQQTPSRSGDIR